MTDQLPISNGYLFFPHINDVDQLIINYICSIQDIRVLLQISKLHYQTTIQSQIYQNWKSLYERVDIEYNNICDCMMNFGSFRDAHVFVIACILGNPLYKYLSFNIKPYITFDELIEINKWAIRFSCMNGHFDIARDLFFNRESFYLEYAKKFIDAPIKHINKIIIKHLHEDLEGISLLSHLCAKGDLSAVQSLIQFGKDTGKCFDIHRDRSYAIRICVKKGFVDIAQWLIKLSETSLNRSNEVSPERLTSLDPFFCSAIKHKQIAFAKWLLELSLNPSYYLIDVHGRNEFAITTLCEYGELDSVKWFVEKVCANPLFGPFDYGRDDSDVFATACAFNRLSVAMYLFDFAKLHGIPVYPNLAELFEICCVTGSLDIIKWFVQLKLETDSELFESSEDDSTLSKPRAPEFASINIHANNDECLYSAAQWGKLNVVQYLMELGENPLIGRFDIDIKELIFIVCMPSENVVVSEEATINMLRWILNLHKIYSYVPIYDIHANNEELFKIVIGSKLFIAKFLFEYSLSESNIGAIDLHIDSEAPFIIACNHCNIDSVKWLVELSQGLGSPIDIHARNEFAVCVLFKWIIKGRYNLLDWLISLADDPIYGPFNKQPIIEALNDMTESEFSEHISLAEDPIKKLGIKTKVVTKYY